MSNTIHEEYADPNRDSRNYQFLFAIVNRLFESEESSEALDGQIVRQVTDEEQEDGSIAERTTIFVSLDYIDKEHSGQVLILDKIGENKKMALVQMPEDEEGQPEYIELGTDAVFELQQQIISAQPY